MRSLQKFGLLFVMLFALAVGAPAFAQTASPTAAPAMQKMAAPTGATEASNKAVAWLLTQQRDDGGFGPDAASPSTLGQTSDAIFAFAAAGKAPAGISKNGKSLTYYLVGHIAQAKSAGETCKTALAAATSLPVGGESYAGVNIYQKIDGYYNSSTGQYGSSTIDHIYCLFAQKQLGREVPPAALTALQSLQISDGSWAFAGAGKPNDGDTNTTALAVQALIANGVSKDAAPMQKAVAYLKSQQNADGGFPYQNPSQYGTDTDANSTAYVVQALVALGLDPASDAGFTKGGSTPLAALLKLQQPSGAVSFQQQGAADNLLATLQAVPALNYATQPQLPVRSDGGQTYPTPDITSVPAVVATPTAVLIAQATPVPSANTPNLPQTGSGGAGAWLLIVVLAAVVLAAGVTVKQASRQI